MLLSSGYFLLIMFQTLKSQWKLCTKPTAKHFFTVLNSQRNKALVTVCEHCVHMYTRVYAYVDIHLPVCLPALHPSQQFWNQEFPERGTGLRDGVVSSKVRSRWKRVLTIEPLEWKAAGRAPCLISTRVLARRGCHGCFSNWKNSFLVLASYWTRKLWLKSDVISSAVHRPMCDFNISFEEHIGWMNTAMLVSPELHVRQ